MRKYKSIDWNEETMHSGVPHVLSFSEITGIKEINGQDCPYSKAADLLRVASAYANT